MGNIKAGFARLDITPPLGTRLVGYYRVRHADGILDPLLATAVAVSDGEGTAVIISMDVIGMNQVSVDRIRHGVAEQNGIPMESVFVCCTHTHLGPAMSDSHDGLDPQYVDGTVQRVIGVAKMALNDMKDAEMYVNSANTPVEVSFIRNFIMKDGSCATNPGFLNPEIDHPLGESDQRVGLVYFKREGAPEIAIINFQVHPDVISGCTISADYPHFVRDTYEAVIPNSRVLYINGAQGDSNHINVKTPEHMLRKGYAFSQHIGRTVAGTAIALYAMAEKVEAFPVVARQINIEVPYNKAKTPEELENAKYIKMLHDTGRDGEIPIPEGHGAMSRTTALAAAERIVALENAPDTKTLHITGVRLGDFALVGFPGEPFTEIGRLVREASDYKMTYISCCANGHEGYYPSAAAMEAGSYEAAATKYCKNISETLVDAGRQMLDELKK